MTSVNVSLPVLNIAKKRTLHCKAARECSAHDNKNCRLDCLGLNNGLQSQKVLNFSHAWIDALGEAGTQQQRLCSHQPVRQPEHMQEEFIKARGQHIHLDGCL